MVECIVNFYSEGYRFNIECGEVYLKEVQVKGFLFVFLISSLIHLRPGYLKMSSAFFGKSLLFKRNLTFSRR